MTYENFKIELVKELHRIDAAHTYSYIALKNEKEILICLNSKGIGRESLVISDLYEESDKSISLAHKIARLFSSSVRFSEFRKNPEKSYEKLKDIICCRLIVSNDDNKQRFRNAYTIPYLNFEIVFYLNFYGMEQQFHMVYTLTKRLIESWSISQKNLLDTAKANTMRLEMPEITPISVLAKELADVTGIPELRHVSDFLQTDGDCYMVTNEHKNYGTTALLFPEIFECVARQNGHDLYLFALSPHEIAVEPVDRQLKELQHITRLLCQEPDNAAYSRYVYLYRKGSGQISMCLDSDNFSF